MAWHEEAAAAAVAARAVAPAGAYQTGEKERWVPAATAAGAAVFRTYLLPPDEPKGREFEDFLAQSFANWLLRKLGRYGYIAVWMGGVDDLHDHSCLQAALRRSGLASVKDVAGRLMNIWPDKVLVQTEHQDSPLEVIWRAGEGS